MGVKRPHWVVPVLALFAAPVVIYCCYWVLVFVALSPVFRLGPLPADASPRPFHPTKWADGGNGTRIGMAKQLVTDGALVGRSRDDLIAMLGTPSDRFGTPNETWWFVGEGGQGMFDDWYILVTFGEDQKTVAAEIKRMD